MKIVDMHCDTISKIWKSRRESKPQGLSCNKLHVDIEKMKQSGYFVQNFAMFVDLRMDLDPFEYVMDLIKVFYEEILENKSSICAAKSYNEMLENERNGKMSALLTIEEGACCKGDVKRLERLYELGARMMTLTWNYPNELANPNIFSDESSADGFPLFDGSRGLTETGFDFISRMEEIGMIIDVSHLSDAGFWDIAHSTKKPFVASHSNARALSGHPRNLTDDMIREIGNRGGVIGLNYYGCFLNEKYSDVSTAERIAAHASHIANVGGIECLGLGSDFDGISGSMEMEDCSQLYKLFDALERAGFSADAIDRIAGANVLRVYKEMLT